MDGQMDCIPIEVPRPFSQADLLGGGSLGSNWMSILSSFSHFLQSLIIQV